MSSFVPFKINKRPKDSNSPRASDQPGTLHVRLVEAIGLPSNDILGSSDPYCKVYLTNAPKSANIFNKQFKSDFIKKCTDPIFNTATSLEICNEDLEKGLLQLHLFDHDMINNDTELGIASVPLSHFKSNEFFQGWLPVRPSEEDSKTQNNQPQQKKQQSTAVTAPVATTDTTDQKPVKKKFGMFSKKNIGGMMSSVQSKVANNKHLTKVYQTATNVLETGAEAAKNVAGHVADKVTEAIQQQGKRSREHGRLYVVIRYTKHNKNSFEEKANNISKHLQIVNNPCKPSPINIFSFTFNAGNCKLSDFNDGLSEWLPKDKNIDLYVLGFQELNQKKKDDKKEDDSDSDDDEEEEETNQTEMEDDKKENEIEYEDNDQQIRLEQFFLQYLGNNYVTVSHRNMWQTRIFVFVKKKHSDVISNVISHFAATGIAGFGPNKGGVAVAFDYDGVSLCFVSCHLAAHQTKIKHRNADYSKICKNLKINSSKQQLLGQFHCIILMGDLNYRVDFFGEQHENKPEPETYKKACSVLEDIASKGKKKKYGAVLKYDQLMNCMQSNDAFIGFNELPIAFAPTFKMERKIGMNYIYKRLPAWCDRILWRCCDGVSVKANTYKMYPDVSISDHKPVSCMFSINKWERSCAISDKCKKAMIHFRKVSGIDLKISDEKNGKTDPFVHFPKQLLLEKKVQSKGVNGDIVGFGLIRNSLPFLGNALLMFQIRDRELKSVMDMDVIGYGFVELRKCVKKLNKWVSFQKQVTLNGMKAGVFKGEIKLEYETKKK